MDVRRPRLTPRRRVLGAAGAAAQTCIVGAARRSICRHVNVGRDHLATRGGRQGRRGCVRASVLVLRILRRHDLAADVMEQAYLQIRRDAGQFDPAHSGPLAWMVAIARRLAIDLARGPQPPATDSEPEIIDEDEGPGSVPRHQLTDDLKRLLTCIGRLEPDRQRMLLLAYYGAFSREQLSSKLDMPIDLLRASLRRSLLEIDQCLKS